MGRLLKFLGLLVYWWTHPPHQSRVLQAKFPQSSAMKPNPSCTASASEGQGQAGYDGDKSAEQNLDRAAVE